MTTRSRIPASLRPCSMPGSITSLRLKTMSRSGFAVAMSRIGGSARSGSHSPYRTGRDLIAGAPATLPAAPGGGGVRGGPPRHAGVAVDDAPAALLGDRLTGVATDHDRLDG